MIEIYPKWEFLRKRDLGARNIDPAEDLFFEKLPPLGAIIRESTQNSLDASKNGSQVRMKISINTGLFRRKDLLRECVQKYGSDFISDFIKQNLT